MASLSRFIIYEVKHSYDPSEHDGHEGCIAVEVGDIMEVDRAEGNNNHEGWLNGKNRRSGDVGLFPKEFVVERPRPKPTRPTRPSRQHPIDDDRSHKLKQVYFVRPVLCAFCSDYIWGTGPVGKQCEGCSQCYHVECEELLRTSASTANICQPQVPPLSPPVHNQHVALREWDTENILEWMAVVNLGRYVQIFQKRGICGQNLYQLTSENLEEMLIRDEFHKDAILACTSALCDWESSIKGAVLPAEDGRASDHNLDIYCFTTLLYCHICGRALWGLWHQGFQCRVCGLRCHRKCVVYKLPRCNPERLEINGGCGIAEDGLFGLELSDNGEPPPIVERCTRELEVKAQLAIRTSPAKLILDAYRLPVPAHDIQRLKKAFATAGDIRSLDLNAYELTCIAGALKKYLRELPTSVIPPAFYARLISESKKTEESGCLQGMRELVSELPANHALTLKIIMVHLSKVCRMSSNNQDPSPKLAQVFCHVLIRPPWESVIETVFNMDDHYRAVLLILKCQEWTDLPPAIPPRKLPAQPSSTSSQLEMEEWYWGDTKKEEIAERMGGMSDGTFAVRNATDRTQGTTYTLTVRKGGTNMLLRVYERDGRVSLSDSHDFASLIELIDYHRRNSLASFNKKLDIVLKTPLPRFVTPVEETSQTTDEQQFVRSHVEFITGTEEYNSMQAKLSEITEDMQTKQLYLTAAKETASMLENHWRLSVSNREFIKAADMKRAEENIELIISKLSNAQEMCNSLEYEIYSGMQEIRNLQNSIQTSNRQLNSLQKTIETLQRKLRGSGCTSKTLEQVIETSNKWLLEQGSDANSIDQLWFHLDSNVLHAPSLPHLDSRTWQSTTFDREQAETLLRTKPEGTFLIRPSSDGQDALALSIVCKAEPLQYAERHALPSTNHSELTVVHCKIEHTETGYGFAEPYYIHESLTDLVLHYRVTSLVEHNDSLDVTLKYPAFVSGPSGAGPGLANGGNHTGMLSYVSFDPGNRSQGSVFHHH